MSQPNAMFFSILLRPPRSWFLCVLNSQDPIHGRSKSCPHITCTFELNESNTPEWVSCLKSQLVRASYPSPLWFIIIIIIIFCWWITSSQFTLVYMTYIAEDTTTEIPPVRVGPHKKKNRNVMSHHINYSSPSIHAEESPPWCWHVELSKSGKYIHPQPSSTKLSGTTTTTTTTTSCRVRQLSKLKNKGGEGVEVCNSQ